LPKVLDALYQYRHVTCRVMDAGCETCVDYGYITETVQLL